MPNGSASVLEISNLSKRFGGIQALDDVRLTVSPERIRALVGANGSGKSTLVKVVAGYHRPDSGVARIAGVDVPLDDERRLREVWNVGAVHQDLALIDELSVGENFLLPYLASTGNVRLNWPALRSIAKPYLERFGVRVSLRSKVGQTPRVDRALLALARAVYVLESPVSGHAGSSDATVGRPRASSTLILDEITAFLNADEVDMLRTAVRGIADEGFNVLFVSHDLDEIVTFADDVTVLRDGRVVSDCAVNEIDKKSLFTLIAGYRPTTAPASDGRIRRSGTARAEGDVTVSELRSSDGQFGPVDFAVGSGEILGLTGLIGTGFDQIPYALFGECGLQAGTLELGGRTYALAKLKPAEAIALGIALVPGDRARQGLWMHMSIGENLAVTNGSMTERPLALSWRAVWSRAQASIEEFKVKAAGVRSRVADLSGGNAQRVMLAKWLSAAPSLLLLHEPVQGVDVGARVQIAELIRRRAENGLAVLCASADHEFLAHLCDRVLIFNGGVVRSELLPAAPSTHITKAQILWACQMDDTRLVVSEQGGVVL